MALTGLSTAATNEFAEVVLGGTIAIPAAVVFFGVSGAMAIAQGGTFDLGIVAMGVVFQGLPGPEILGRLAAFLWFFLLFVALAVLYGVFLSVAAVLLEEISFRRYPGWIDLSKLIVFGILENFGYRQLLALFKVKAMYDVVRRRRAWGRMDRVGFRGPERVEPVSGRGR